MKYNKPELIVYELDTDIIASTSKPIGNVGDNDSWDDGIVEEFSWED